MIVTDIPCGRWQAILLARLVSVREPRVHKLLEGSQLPHRVAGCCRVVRTSASQDHLGGERGGLVRRGAADDEKRWEVAMPYG